MTRRQTWKLLAACLALAAMLPARADHALVVGIDHYVHLPANAQLGGADNDAAAMRKRLSALGFAVTLLSDAQATRQGILDALSAMKAQNTSRERFVFYFAGHGARDPDGNGVILPSDADPSDRGSVLGRDALYGAVRGVPASGRTVILDSCFSGAMGRAFDLQKGLHPARTSRFYNFYGMPKRLVVVSRVNAATDPMAVGGGVCYFVAADPHQQACEDDIDGQRDGLFTHFLVSRLRNTTEPWRRLQTDVTSAVMAESRETQTPMLSSGYANRTIFSDVASPLPDALRLNKGQSLWDEFNESAEDLSQLRFEMDPDSSTVAIGQKFTFRATPGSDGFLVVMEMDTDGDLDLVYPSSRAAGDARVAAGGEITLPADPTQAFTVDKEGAESLKAILFRSQEEAQGLLSAFPPDLTVPSVLAAQGRQVEMANDAPFATASLDFEVSGQAPAGGE